MDFLLCTHESALSCWLSNSEELFLLANVLLYHTLFTPRKLVSFLGLALNGFIPYVMLRQVYLFASKGAAIAC